MEVEKMKVKFFNKEKGFGFLTREDGSEVFFHVSGYVRRVPRLYATRNISFTLSSDQQDQLRQDVEIEVIEVASDPKGDKVVLWACPMIHALPDLYVIVSVTAEREETESQSQERRMWVTNKTTTALAVPFFIGSKKSAEEALAMSREEDPKGVFRVYKATRDSQGLLNLDDSFYTQVATDLDRVKNAGSVDLKKGVF